MKIILAFLAVFFIGQSCFAWSEGGHHLIAVMADQLLDKGDRLELLTILDEHPRFAEDFTPPKTVNGDGETQLWLIGRAGYWPDVARSQPKFNRPNWHWQLGSSLTIGEVVPPENPGPVPGDATLDTMELHIAQAVQLCRKTLKDKKRSNSDRALAICWLAHLVADAHQPCHAGSLYVAGVFDTRDGDRGANSIPTKQRRNLHALWDGLLGPQFDAGDIRRRIKEIQSSDAWSDASEEARAPDTLDPLTWLHESSRFARSHVYAGEVMVAVEAAARGTLKVETVDLSEEYLKAAGELAQRRAAFAARRLAGIFRESLN